MPGFPKKQPRWLKSPLASVIIITTIMASGFASGTTTIITITGIITITTTIDGERGAQSGASFLLEAGVASA